MKIEKLTDNKIRVIINSNDLELNNLNIHTIMSKTLETQDIFLDILKKAEQEVDFKTEGCKLLIEAFSLSDDFCVFMITKYNKKDEKEKKPENSNRHNYKRLTAKKKDVYSISKNMIYDFKDFETFCNFCSFLNNLHQFDINKLCENVSLYSYNQMLYLILSNINIEYKNKDTFLSSITEFAKLSNHTKSFSSKLLEHGKPIIKNNAISIGIQYFSD